MEDSRDESKSGSGVDQGADILEPPHALYTPGDELPRETGYEPKLPSTGVVGSAQGTRSIYDSSHTWLVTPTPGQPPISTASVRCAGWGSGNDNGTGVYGPGEERHNPFEEMLALQLGQNSSLSENRDFGTEISELEEKIQGLAIREQQSHQSLCEEMLKFSTREDAEILQKNI